MTNTIIQWVIRTLAGVSAEQWKKVLALVLQAAGTAIPNENRKEWVVTQINKWLSEKNLPPLSVGVVNFLIEAALRFLKKNKTITT